MYNKRQFLQDIGGYGKVMAAFEGQSRISAARQSQPVPNLRQNDVRTFVNQLYGYVSCRPGLTIYRWFDDDKAHFVARFWSPARPSAEIDALRLPTMHSRSRDNLAVTKQWNKMQKVLEASLRPGTTIVVGRAASQFDSGRKLGGGAIQILIPHESMGGLVLRRTHEGR